MKLVTRVALCAALVAALAACKKDDKKSEPAAKAEGSGTATATAAATGAASGTAAAKPQSAEALSAVKGAIAMADAPKGAMPNLGMSGGSGGGLGGLGAALGGLFGGGGGGARAEAAVAPSADSKAAKPAEPAPPGDSDEPTAGGGDMPPEYANIDLPPPAPKGGDCSAVADRIQGLIVAMMEVELGKLPADQRGLVQGQMDEMVAEMHGQMKEMCESQKWPQALKDCVLTAPDMTALQQCEQYVTDEMKQGGGMDGPSGPDEPEPPAEPVAPAPAWTGGDDCSAVGQRVMQVAMMQAGEMPPEVKAEVEASMAEAIEQIAEVCTQGNWSAEVRGCFFKAGTMEAIEACFQNTGM